MKQLFWTEEHSAGATHYCADYSSDLGWMFAERDSFEIKWFPLASTPALIAKVARLLAEAFIAGAVDENSTVPPDTKPIVVRGGNSSATTTNKDWGFEILYGVTRGVALKQLTVKAKEALSRQFHVKKDELYRVDEGSGLLELGVHGEVVHQLSKGDVVHVPPGLVHRLIAGEDGIVVTEASTPEITDIVRLEDRYNRPVNDNFDPIAYTKKLKP